MSEPNSTIQAKVRCYQQDEVNGPFLREPSQKYFIKKQVSRHKFHQLKHSKSKESHNETIHIIESEEDPIEHT